MAPDDDPFVRDLAWIRERGSPRPRRPRKRRGPGRLGSLEVKLLLFYIYIRTFFYGNILTARGLVDTSSMSLFGVTGFSYAPLTPCFARSVVSGLGPGRARAELRRPEAPRVLSTCSRMGSGLVATDPARPRPSPPGFEERCSTSGTVPPLLRGGPPLVGLYHHSCVVVLLQYYCTATPAWWCSSTVQGGEQGALFHTA